MRDFLLGVFTNATWDLIRWVLLEAGMITALMGTFQKIKTGALDWWLLGVLFVVSSLGFYLVSARDSGDIVSDRRQVVREQSWAPPCQLRISESEREKIQKFLQEHNPQRLTVRKIEIVVERGRKEDCLYAKDLQRVFEEISWMPPEIVEEIPVVKEVRGKAVWFENLKGDELAGVFWTQILCFLGQDFYHEGQEDSSLKEKWMFYIRDSQGGHEPHSPEVICLNKSPSRETLPHTP